VHAVKRPLRTVLTYGPLLAIAAILLILVYLQSRGTEELERSFNPIQTSAQASVNLSAIRLPDPPKKNLPSSPGPLQAKSKPTTAEVGRGHTEVLTPLDAQSENLPSEDDALAFLKTPLQPNLKSDQNQRKVLPLLEGEVTPVSETRVSGWSEVSGKRVPLNLSPVMDAQPMTGPRRSESKERAGTIKTTITLTEAAVRDGRALLRILEHGAGPEIEMAWPASVKDRELLFVDFRDCYGMRIAALTSSEGLYTLDDGLRRPWTLDLDTYSGFVRRPEGQVTEIERAMLRYAEHDANVEQLVRIFPRQVDAALLGGLKLVTGSAYADARSIQATYKISVGGVSVTGVQIDGRAAGGAFDLRFSRVRRCQIG